jgi:hypothetical protein
MKLCISVSVLWLVGGDKIVIMRSDVKGIRNCGNKPPWFWHRWNEENYENTGQRRWGIAELVIR